MAPFASSRITRGDIRPATGTWSRASTDEEGMMFHSRRGREHTATPARTAVFAGARRARVGRAAQAITLALAALALGAPAALAQVSFSGPINFTAGTSPRSVAVADFNGDSAPDLAVANSQSDTVSVLLGQAGGGFSGPADFAAGDGPVSVAVGD